MYTVENQRMKIFQENGVFAYIPLSYLAMVDTTAISQIITALTGVIVAIFAVRYYIANTKKAEVDKEIAEIERDNLLMDRQVTEVAKTKGLKARKKTQNDE